eukprot:TRINITY_DN7866_c1_g1_i1.p4 TRINITY_DN7866_c1_g1~~TRINITY_DN7866_c1_g1_i1.p4  ORF type:complete len:119 (-),score=8.70 TRINITY_DN7866_c1_g1_i1:444-800(-)
MRPCTRLPEVPLPLPLGRLMCDPSPSSFHSLSSCPPLSTCVLLSFSFFPFLRVLPAPPACWPSLPAPAHADDPPKRLADAWYRRAAARSYGHRRSMAAMSGGPGSLLVDDLQTARCLS